MTELDPTHRFVRVLGMIGAVMGSATTFAVALAAGVLLHLNLPAVRRFATRELNAALAAEFKGGLTLERIAALHLDEVSGIDVRVSAPDGSTVVLAHGVRGRIRPIGLVKSLLRRSGNLDIDVFGIDVESAEVNLDADEAGSLKLATAFELLTPSNATSSGRALHLTLRDITVRRAFVHGQMKGLPPIDADLEGLRGAVLVDGSQVTVDVSRVALVAHNMPQGANPRGVVEARILVPAKNGSSLELDADFDGTVGDIPVTAKAAFDGVRLDAMVDVPEVSDEKVRALALQIPIYRPVAIHAEAHGDFARLHTTARVAIRTGGELQAEGDLTLAEKFAATIGLDLRNVDLRALSLTAPSSRLALHADFRVDTKPDGLIDGVFTTDIPGGKIGGEFIPPGVFHGAFEQKGPSAPGAGGSGVGVRIEGVVSEPGAPIQVRAALRTDAPSPVVDFDVSSRVARFTDVPRLAVAEHGSGQVRVQGSLVLGADPLFDIKLDGSVDGFTRSPISVEHGQFAAHAFGSLAKPQVDATLEAEALEVARYKFHHARVTTGGPLSAERVTVLAEGDGAPSVRASAIVRVSGSPEFENVDLDVSRSEHALHATATRVKIDSAGLAVADASITGIGQPIRASLDTRSGSLVVRGSSKGVDLQALGYLLGLEDKVRQGQLAFAIDLAARPDGADGSATADLTHGSFGSVDEVSGHVETQMDGRKITGSLRTSAGDVGTLDVSQMDLELGGRGPLKGDSWRRTWGILHIDGQVNLAKVASLLPPNSLPFSKLAGRLTLHGHIRRDNEADVTPDLAFTVQTSGLQVAPRYAPDQKIAGTTVVATPQWASSGIDVALDVQADGDSGFAEIAARLIDKEGALVSLDAKSASVPYERLFASSDGALELLKGVPFSAVIVAPSRKLDHLPEILRPAGASGNAEARISIDGTFRKPAIQATLKTKSVKFDRSPLTSGINADVTANYDGAAGDVILDARASKNGVLHASMHVNAKAEEILNDSAGTFPWDASAKADFTHFPLGSIVGLADRQVRGQISGRIELLDLHKDARATVDINVANLRVGAEAFKVSELKVAVDGRSLEAGARLERDDAMASATLKVGTTWGTSMVPSLDPSGSAEAAFHAKHLPAAILAPLAESVLDEIEGTIDADAHLLVRPNERPRMDGAIALNDGIIEVTALGQELHNVNGRVILTPDGILRLERLSASGTTGKLTASGVAHLDGLKLAGAEVVFSIPKGNAMPLALQGASVGTVYGQFDMTATSSSDHKALTLKVDVPTLHIELPEASSHSVEELDAAEPQNHVGTYSSSGTFALLPLDEFDVQEESAAPPKASNTLTVDVHLGQNVEVQRGTDLKVDLSGDLEAKIGTPTEVTGQIRTKGGKLDVQGKPFEIESGTVTFLGDSSNPEVHVTASWTAGDGTRVFADYVGPLKTGKVILRSEPARPQNEILALILFGTADGLQPAPSAAGSQSNAAASAGTAVGGFATAGLSKGFNKLTGMEVTAKIDTSGTNTKPEVAVQIAKDISLQLAVILGTAQTNPDTTFATIDWRFFKDWSLETTVGNLGTAIADVVWQHRY